MGQTLCIARQAEETPFTLLPLELGFRILEFLDASSLCSLALVNSDMFRLSSSNLLWKGLCLRRVPALSSRASSQLNLTWKQIHKIIRVLIHTFNTDGERGINMFIDIGLVPRTPEALAMFLGRTRGLSKQQIGSFVAKPSNLRVLESYVRLSNYQGAMLAEALRNFLTRFEIPKADVNARIPIIECFALHYAQSNPALGFDRDTILILCLSLVLLGTDLSSPHVKNKMSKREFIRNNKRIITSAPLTDDYLGELYDFIFLEGLFPIKQEPRRCNAVLNQLIMDNRGWQLLPRVLPLPVLSPRSRDS